MCLFRSNFKVLFIFKNSANVIISELSFFFLPNMQGTPVNIIVGSHVWIEDPEVAWLDGQVSKITGQEAEIQASNGKKVGKDLFFLSYYH